MIKLNYDTCLVTGGAGFIGSHICEELVKQNKQVLCLDNLVAGYEANLQSWWNPKLCTFIKTDITDITTLIPYFTNVDVVFHNAASKCTVCRDDPMKDLMVNARGSWCVFEAAKQAKVKKIIHASTGSVMNSNPVSFYGVSKQTGEAYLKAFKSYYPFFYYSVLRYYHVYGSRQESSDVGGVIPIFIRRILNDQPVIIHGTGLQIRHFTNVKDVVRANLFTANLLYPNGETYNVVSDVRITITELAKMIYKSIGKEPKLEYTNKRPGDIDQFDISSDKLSTLGFEYQVDFEEGLKETIDYYREAHV